jgi:hypothetical protein
MKRIAFLLVVVATVAAWSLRQPQTSGRADEAAPIFLTEMPQGYRDLILISVSRLTAGKGSPATRRARKRHRD